MANLTRESEGNGKASPAPGDQAAWDPFWLMREMFRWDPFRMPAVGHWTGGFEPRFEMTESEDVFELSADLPGVKEEDLEISLTADRLTISGHREKSTAEVGEHALTSERSFGRFARSFTLPGGTDPEHIRAEFEDGVLKLKIAKRPKVQPKRIAITKRAEGRRPHKAKKT